MKWEWGFKGKQVPWHKAKGIVKWWPRDVISYRYIWNTIHERIHFASSDQLSDIKLTPVIKSIWFADESICDHFLFLGWYWLTHCECNGKTFNNHISCWACTNHFLFCIVFSFLVDKKSLWELLLAPNACFVCYGNWYRRKLYVWYTISPYFRI